MPLFADLLQLCRRGDLPSRTLGWRLDGISAGVPLSSARRLRLRSAARCDSSRRELAAAVALRQVAQADGVILFEVYAGEASGLPFSTT